MSKSTSSSNNSNSASENEFTALDAFSSFLGDECQLPENWTIDYDKIYKGLGFALRDLAFANRERFPQFHPNGRFDQEAFNDSFKSHFGFYNEYRFSEEQLLEVAKKRLRMTKDDLIRLHDAKIEFFDKAKNRSSYRPTAYAPASSSPPTSASSNGKYEVDDEPVY